MKPRFARIFLPLTLIVWAVLAAGPVRAVEVETEIVGIHDKEIARNIEVSLSIIRDKKLKGLTEANVTQMYDRGPMEIAKAVQPFGYYQAVVEGTLTPEGNGKFAARYVVTLKDPVRVRDVHVEVIGEGHNKEPFPTLVKQFPLKKGDVLDQRLYTRAKNEFSAVVADSGYLDARFVTSAIRIQKAENVADVDIALDTGPLYHFGEVKFDSSVVDERVLRTYVRFKPGDPFRYSQLLAFQSNLGGTPYFSRVEAVPRRDLATGTTVPIEVKLDPRRPRRFEIGVGYGTDTGPRVLFNTEFRRLNESGHRFTLRTNVSQLELSLNAAYVIPSLYPKKHEYTIAALAARIEPNAYTTDRFATGPTRSQPRFGWLESITLSYEHEDYTVGPDDGITDLFVAGLTYSHKRADDLVSPRNGHRIDLGIRGASDQVWSSQSFASLTGSGKVVRTLAPKWRILARADAGFTETHQFRDLPPTVRFFAGGDNSVRGYEYQSLGPRADDNKVIGGETLLTGSGELEYAFMGKFALAGFYDAGNAFTKSLDGKVERGVGGGLRWKSPVGPIRLDLAFPLEHDGFRLHFTMGPDL
jgi:translocation and assembly module TamA